MNAWIFDVKRDEKDLKEGILRPFTETNVDGTIFTPNVDISANQATLNWVISGDSKLMREVNLELKGGRLTVLPDTYNEGGTVVIHVNLKRLEEPFVLKKFVKIEAKSKLGEEETKVIHDSIAKLKVDQEEVAQKVEKEIEQKVQPSIRYKTKYMDLALNILKLKETLGASKADQKVYYKKLNKEIVAGNFFVSWLQNRFVMKESRIKSLPLLKEINNPYTQFTKGLVMSSLLYLLKKCVQFWNIDKETWVVLEANGSKETEGNMMRLIDYYKSLGFQPVFPSEVKISAENHFSVFMHGPMRRIIEKMTVLSKFAL